jgi:hypothetical protein
MAGLRCPSQTGTTTLSGESRRKRKNSPLVRVKRGGGEGACLLEVRRRKEIRPTLTKGNEAIERLQL